MELLRKMACENRLWGAERIRGELLKLGIRLSKRSIQKIIARIKRRGPSGLRSPDWTVFLRNHASHIWACDFFTVPTVWFRQIYVFVILAIDSREVLYWNVTDRPDSEWTTRQVTQCTWDTPAPRG